MHKPPATSFKFQMRSTSKQKQSVTFQKLISKLEHFTICKQIPWFNIACVSFKNEFQFDRKKFAKRNDDDYNDNEGRI